MHTIKKALAQYTFGLKSSPYKYKMSTAFTMFFLGDITCQYIDKHFLNTHQASTYDFIRSSRQGIVAGLFGAPFLHLFLTKAVPLLNFKGLSAAQFLFLRIFIHQAVVMPLNIFQFFMITGLLTSGFDIKKTIDNQIPKYKKALIRGWMYWPLLLVIMYRYVPTHFQNLYMDIFVYFFSIMLSYIQSQSSVVAQSVVQ
ncbi:hypothetical protein FGO68_gene16685 [Halteria grandinella]|uniref:Uncharacterized protein n=1 Tax=Halteria grandinella TaxID=5974 RepID=A0A8J8NJK4_HALGN|nr:hypothetical protein FGO68_gene16685 [Halteria grandinella]